MQVNATDYFADLRVDYLNIHQTTEVDKNNSFDVKRYRVRGRAKFTSSPTSSVQVRAAHTQTNRGKQHTTHLDFALPPKEDIEKGHSSIDQLFWKNKRDNLTTSLGRFTVKHTLKTVAGLSLDRKDNIATFITWTDGIRLQKDYKKGWNTDLTIQYNDVKGSGNQRRGPLSYKDSNARVSVLFKLENLESWGHIIQRSVSINALPNSLDNDGDPLTDNEHYHTINGRIAARWPWSKVGDVELGVELGHAFNTPDKATSGIQGHGDSSGLAYHIAASILDLFGHHQISLDYGEADAGWLLSPHFVQNFRRTELYYNIWLNKRNLFELSLVHMEEIEKQISASRRQANRIFLLRFTHWFQ